MTASSLLKSETVTLLDEAVDEYRLISEPITDMEYLYDSLSSTYDLLYPHCDKHSLFFNKRLTDILNSHGAAKVADLACGTGRQSIYLKKENIQVLGIDQSAGMLDKCCFNQKKAGVCFDVIKSDWLNLVNLYFEEFDAGILIGDPLVHIHHQKLTEIFRNIYQILRPKGLLIFNLRDWRYELWRRSAEGLNERYSLLNKLSHNCILFGYKEINQKSRLQSVIFWNEEEKKIQNFWEAFVYKNYKSEVMAALLESGFSEPLKINSLSNCMDSYTKMDCLIARKN